jgi:cytidylate kinase
VIIAIDGPAGSGKSSTAREVARRLGFRHLDSGAFYRTLTWAALRAGIPRDQWKRLGSADLDAFEIEARPGDGGFRFFAGGADVGAAIRSIAVNAHVSDMARVPAVRTWLLERQRAVARDVDLVSDGRDIGTVVFPDADLKVFLVADPRVRAERRLKEQGIVAPAPAEIDAEVARLERRDRIDTDRAVAPLRRAADAVAIDTTALTFEAQVRQIVELAQRRRS